MSTLSGSLDSCMFCKKTFSQSENLWNHVVSGTCSNVTKPESALSSAPEGGSLESSVEADSNPAPENSLTNDGPKGSLDDNPKVSKYEAYLPSESKPFILPPSSPNGSSNSIPLEATSKEVSSVLQGQSEGSSPPRIVDDNSASWKPRTPQTSKGETNAESPFSLLLGAPPSSGPTVSYSQPDSRCLFNPLVVNDFPHERGGTSASENSMRRDGFMGILNGGPAVSKYETSPPNGVKPLTPPRSSSARSDNSVPLEAASNSVGHVLQSQSTENSSASWERRMPQISKGTANTGPPLSSPLGALPSRPIISSNPLDSKPFLSPLVGNDSPCKPVSPQVRTIASAPDNLPSKWKCTLCDIDFADKLTMANHVRSSEHEMRIQVVKHSSGDAPSQSLPRQQSTSLTLPKGELVEIVRRIVAEELPALLRSELRAIFNAALKEPATENVPTESVEPNSQPGTNLDSRCILAQGYSLKCSVCDCCITSQANLAIHLSGKRHRTNLARLENSGGALSHS